MIRFRLRTDKNKLGAHSTSFQRSKIVEWKNGLRRRIDAWIEIQQLYMPNVAALRAREDHEGGGEPVDSPHIKLFLPSTLVTFGVRSDRRLLKYEWRLRFAQALDLLGELRRLLLLSSQLFKSKDRHVRGQRMLTRSQSLINSVSNKIKACTLRYREIHAALHVLAKPLLETTWTTTLQPLLDDDVRAISVAQADIMGKGRQSISWIWRTTSAAQASDVEGMQEGQSLSGTIIDLFNTVHSTTYRMVQVSGKSSSVAGGMPAFGRRNAMH